MSGIKAKYHGKTLTTDEVAVACTQIAEATKELENIEYKTGGDYLLFKWGTLKGWELHSKRGIELSNEYIKIGRSLSGMSQKDTDRQKQIICEMIDECDGTIQSDWSGEYFTKEKAKEYILESSE